MADKPNTQIIIRHIAGAKINRIDPFALADTKEIAFGREAGSTVTYDSPKDDVVSRRHAILRVKKDDPLTFELEDLKSSNGTFVNNERVTGTTEILPEDTVEFGKGGPKFTFDVQPRPASMQARTRVMSAIDATATRAVVTTTAAQTAQTATASQTAAQPVKTGIGKNTVMMMLSDERKKTSQVWLGAMAAVIAFILVGGGTLYWRLKQDSDAQVAQVAAQSASTTSNELAKMKSNLGMTAGEIAKRFTNATVYIEASWRVVDAGTGKPLFHKTVDLNKERMPAYVALPNGKIVRWLTTSDESRTNLRIGGAHSGSGFVISDQGFILTNKHVAAAWLTDFDVPNGGVGALYTYPVKGVRTPAPRKINTHQEDKFDDNWIPEREGGYLFDPEFPINFIGGGERVRTFQGKNDYLEVRFPGNKLSINASLLRVSADADASLLEIRSPQKLDAIELAADDTLATGDKVFVMGYPAIAMKTEATFTTSEGGSTRTRRELIPEPTITDGIVSRLGTETTQQGTTVVKSSMGDAFQLSVTATGSGNSGGPVFDQNGKVVGLFTYSLSNRSRGERITFAVPIKHGRYLLQPQRSQ